jgi:hypothetical protein
MSRNRRVPGARPILRRNVARTKREQVADGATGVCATYRAGWLSGKALESQLLGGGGVLESKPDPDTSRTG